jgi:hypothetical protein
MHVIYSLKTVVFFLFQTQDCNQNCYTGDIPENIRLFFLMVTHSGLFGQSFLYTFSFYHLQDYLLETLRFHY